MHTRKLMALATIGLLSSWANAQLTEIHNPAGIRMSVDLKNHDPVLAIQVPDGPEDERNFKILIPEHITLRPHGSVDADHLYVFRPGADPVAPTWTQHGDSLEYTTTFGEIQFLARATLVADGILFHYEFTNHSATDYDMATAVTDPRFRRVFYDPRLERTYVHRAAGFELLAAETPERLTIPLTDWFPVRYLAAYTIPVPAERTRRDPDGITYRYSAKTVDTPMIATLSPDSKWVAASFSRDPGNVWTNPELTCQHVDPQVPLPHAGHAIYEMKILIFPGTLEEALQKVKAQTPTLK